MRYMRVKIDRAVKRIGTMTGSQLSSAERYELGCDTNQLVSFVAADQTSVIVKGKRAIPWALFSCHIHALHRQPSQSFPLGVEGFYDGGQGLNRPQYLKQYLLPSW